jgi:5-methylcytosine-specific restriction enzyme A
MALVWTWEEDILAMDLYVRVGARNGGSIPGKGSRVIIQLSELLKKLSAYPPELQDEKYRNPDGVYLKLMNLRAVETGGAHGMSRRSGVDAAVWRRYVDDLDALHAEAEAIRLRLQDGTIEPAKTETS